MPTPGRTVDFAKTRAPSCCPGSLDSRGAYRPYWYIRRRALPGYGDQRNYELLLEAGFSRVEVPWQEERRAFSRALEKTGKRIARIAV